ncbi:DUF1127 domain-containing protein [Desertibaculum subflavum]|uniref:DUF1127 domain-containing protein n=1 Tax=Desertibaculum subflavum TaxID=2268458 RepID=UPI000E65F457
MSFFRPGLEIDETLNQSRLEAEPVPASLWARATVFLAVWAERRAARIALSGLDARTLRDIGLTRTMVDFELSQPNSRPIRDPRR